LSNLEVATSFETTSAAGSMLLPQLGKPLLVGVMLAGLGTSTAGAFSADLVSRSPKPSLQTSAGASIAVAEAAAAAIAEIRRLTGFTWDQLARLFRVSRRSVHFWASGKPMTSGHEEHLHRLLAVMRRIDRGSAGINRTELFAAHDEGIPFDLLAAQAYDAAESLLGYSASQRFSAPRPSKEAMAAKAPAAPGDLVGALQDRVHRETGTARPAKSVRARSGR
jgi:DNA-binding transcriptional regulator YiaG